MDDDVRRALFLPRLYGIERCENSRLRDWRSTHAISNAENSSYLWSDWQLFRVERTSFERGEYHYHMYHVEFARCTYYLGRGKINRKFFVFVKMCSNFLNVYRTLDTFFFIVTVWKKCSISIEPSLRVLDSFMHSKSIILGTSLKNAAPSISWWLFFVFVWLPVLPYGIITQL